MPVRRIPTFLSTVAILACALNSLSAAQEPPVEGRILITAISGSAGWSESGKVEDVIDGNLATAWQARSPNGRVEITVDLGDIQEVCEVWVAVDDLSRGYGFQILAANGLDGDREIVVGHGPALPRQRAARQQLARCRYG